MSIKNIIYTVSGILLIGALVWFFFLRSTPEPTPSTNPLGTVDSTTDTGITPTNTSSANQQIPIGSQTSVGQKIFKIAEGPVTDATFFETKNPTSTIVRYTNANNSHSFDLVIDAPGAVAKSVSNTTIPGILRTEWGAQGKVAIQQYTDSTTIKTISFSFPAISTSSTLTQPKIQFFPDGIVDIALSPDATQATYILRGENGVDGYIAKSDGSNSKKVFSIPLTQVTLTWPAPTTILAQTKSAYNAPGILFSIDAISGNVLPLLYSVGLVAIADPTFSYVVYQSTTGGTNTHTSYVHNMKTGEDVELLFKPLPEKCTWGQTASPILYCARPFQQVSANYIDRWRMGAENESDTIFAYNFSTNLTSTVATPGGNQGGEDSDIVSMNVSPNGKYLLFIKKGDRSLWGVRLSQ